ncbi:hypothetical protein EsH8_II_001572 [Colletotrichum jinshuiense]
MSIIAVLGSTGAQGGSGAEVVKADIEDVQSLVAAFKGASAVFCVTDFWQGILAKTLEQAGEDEKRQVLNVAQAAAVTPTLTHFICSALPPAAKVSDGKLKVAHFDYKADAIDHIEQHLPELYAKMTQLWVGWYASNMFNEYLTYLLPIPGTKKVIWFNPSKPDGVVPVGGHVTHNIGIVVDGILSQREKTIGKVVPLITDYMPFKDVLNVWGKVMGREAIYVEASDEAISQLSGHLGADLAAQFRWSEVHSDWNTLFPEITVSLKELGVESKVLGLEQALRALKP